MKEKLLALLPFLVIGSCVISIWAGYLQIKQYYHDAPSSSSNA